MNTHVQQQLSAFFEAIAPWRAAYQHVRLHYFGVQRDNTVLLLAARLYLSVVRQGAPKSPFAAWHFRAGELDIFGAESVEKTIGAILSKEGLRVDGQTHILLPGHENTDITASAPVLLHPEGLGSGNRLQVLTISGANRQEFLRQPVADWVLKAAEVPYDNVNELTVDYRLGSLPSDFSIMEIVARSAVEVYAKSFVLGTKATIGIWIARDLDKNQARLGYRIIHKGEVASRGSIFGASMQWDEALAPEASVGIAELEVPSGALVNCIASYAGHAHHTQWFVDPAIFQNPRAAALSLVDRRNELLRTYLLPESSPRAKAADDFETAISWVIWTLGFAPASFGTNARTRDAFDVVAVCPRGDFLVIECTLGLLKSDSKLSKLVARAAALRETLAASQMQHLKVLAVIISSMTRDQLKADLQAAADAEVLVLTREDLEQVFNKLLLFPDADRLYDRGLAALHETRAALQQHPLTPLS